MNVFEAVKQSVTTRQAAEHYGLITHDNGIAAQARRVVRIMDGKIESDTINEDFDQEAEE